MGMSERKPTRKTKRKLKKLKISSETRILEFILEKMGLMSLTLPYI